MRYKEFKKTIEKIADTYNVDLNVIKENDYVSVKSYNYAHIYIDNQIPYYMEIWGSKFKSLEDNLRHDLLRVAYEFAQTSISARQDEKRYIIPLLGLTTTDGKQQYLSYKDSFYFASRRDETLRQTWKERHLKYIPEIYRQFAVEFDEGKEY